MAMSCCHSGCAGEMATMFVQQSREYIQQPRKRSNGFRSFYSRCETRSRVKSNWSKPSRSSRARASVLLVNAQRAARS